VRYFKIKRSGETLGGYPKYSAYMLGGHAQTNTSRLDARCKQAYGWHIHVLHIFLIEIHI
jgi:hypothetical protein